jgi:DeoR/GlpR family transcriptional regulator of sugar metabolism
MRSQRERIILDHLHEVKAATVGELAAATGSSPATIRRDLAELDQSGLIRRSYGGAVVVDEDAPFASVEPVNREAKQLIAARAAQLIEEGQSVILDIGTTTLQVAHLLSTCRVTVITASMPICEVLRASRTVHLVVLPGDYDPVYRTMSGPLTIECLRLIRADHAFLGVSGVSVSGDLRDTTLAQVPIKRAIAEAGLEVSVLADHSKFPGTGVGQIPLPSNVARFVTDRHVPAEFSSALAARNVQVIVG